jgi:hypothetical protein
MPVETRRENEWTVMTLAPDKGEVKNKLPFPCYVSAECEGLEVMNPYSKQSCTLTAEAYAVYEVSSGHESHLYGSGNAQSVLLFMGLCKKRNFLVSRTLSEGILRLLD